MAQKLHYEVSIRPRRHRPIAVLAILAVLALIVLHSTSTGQLSRRTELATTFRLLGLHLGDYVDRHDTECQQFAKPHVAKFLNDHPCRGMDRELITVYDKANHCIVVSIIWVDLPDRVAASAFNTRYLAGEIATWGSTRLHIDEPVLTGATRHSRVTNALVTDAEAVRCAPAGAADEDIENAASVAAWFFRP